MFLATSADIAIYGGGAGAGKTYASLLEPCRHKDNPLFRGVIFRRTSPQITNPGGLWDESQQLYPLLGAVPNRSSLNWTFPSGAMLRFAHMQHEKNMYDWQGAQGTFFAFDELTHFESAQFWYMFSRNRSMSGIKPYIRATTNPEPGWVADLIAWWIDQATGYAIPERAGLLRWFVRVNEVLEWADSADELRQRYPGLEPKSLTFIPAKLSDNKILMDKDPSYLANLMALPLVERERLLGGNWKITPSGGKVFNRSWFEIVTSAPEGGVETRFWDFAATEKKSKGDDPDYSAGVKFRKVNGVYYIMDCIDVQRDPAAVEALFKDTARKDREAAARTNTTYRLRWEIEGGSAGKRENWRLVNLMDGYDAKGVTPQGDKLARAKPLAVQSEFGNVKVVQGAWNERWLTHMHHQPDFGHDDIMDASSGAYSDLLDGSVILFGG